MGRLSDACSCLVHAVPAVPVLGAQLWAPAFRMRPFFCALPGGVSVEDWLTLSERAFRRRAKTASPPFSWAVLLREEVAGFRCWDLPPFLVQAELQGPLQFVSVD